MLWGLVAAATATRFFAPLEPSVPQVAGRARWAPAPPAGRPAGPPAPPADVFVQLLHSATLPNYAGVLASAVVAAAVVSQSKATPKRSGRVAAPQMRVRFEDAEERRLSKGGSGGAAGNARVNAMSSREQKLQRYLDNDDEPADPLIGKIIAGSMLVTIFGLLFAVFMYYGADGLVAATAGQRAVRGY